jgi:hypothetical protein
MKSIIRNIIILAIIVALGIVGYKMFFNKKPAATGGLATTSGSVQTVPAASSSTPVIDPSVGQDFLALLLSVQSIRLDDSIFKSKEFAVLQDFNRPIPPDQNPGRVNPFAPLGADGAASIIQISTSNPSSITANASTLNGTLAAADQGSTRWFEYGTTPSLGTMTPPKMQTTPGAFAEPVTGLSPNTTYFVKASALIGGKTVSGNVVTWKTAQGGTQKR